MKTFSYVCRTLHCPTHNITLLTAKPSDPENHLLFTAGQYVKALLQNGSTLLLSIANAPQPDGALVFHLRHHPSHPLAEKWLKETKQTGKLYLQGPYGNSTLTHAPEHSSLVFLAGGTGFAPIRSLLEALTIQQDRFFNVKLFWGISRPEDIYDLEFIEYIKTTLHHFEPHFVLSHFTEYPTWKGPTGWVHDYCNALTKKWENTTVFASGPFEMVQAAFHAFTQKGLAPTHFVSDLYSN